MRDEKFIDPFEPPEEVVSGKLETRGEAPNTANPGSWKVWNFFTADEYAKLKWHAKKNETDVSALLHGIVEDFLKGLPEPPK